MLLQELNVLGDLGNWNEGDLREGWEAELSLDEGHLINETKVAMKEKRMKEREFRRKTQIAVRAQQRTLVGNTSPSLGIKQV